MKQIKFYLPAFLLCFLSYLNVNAQAPNISFTGSPYTFNIGTTITSLTPSNSGGAVPATTPGAVTTLAGSGTSGSTDATGTAASFYWPTGVAADASGNVYVVDGSNRKIRKITTAGVVTTFAGSGAAGSVDGTGTAASFSSPAGVAIDASGNLYIGDQGNSKIRKITSAGVVTTFAGSGTNSSIDGTGTAASFTGPYGVAVDASGNVYVTEYFGYKVRKITSAGVVTTLAGSGTNGSVDGTGAAAQFGILRGIGIDALGNLYVGDDTYNNIRKITPAGVVTTIAGTGSAGSADGTGTAASFNRPFGVAVDASGNLYVADFANNRIRKITSAGVVTTFAGSATSGSTDATGTAARFNSPSGVGVDASGNLYVTDYNNHKIRKISLFGYMISPALPTGLNFNATSGVISGTATVATAATSYTITATNATGSGSVVISIATVVAAPNISYTGSPFNFTTGTAITTLTPTNSGGAVPSATPGTVSTFAGSGTVGSVDATGTAASFKNPFGLVVDATGNVYVVDEGNQKIRKITSAGVVTTFAGTGTAGSVDGTGTAASFNSPSGITIDASGNLFIADFGNHKIRKITSAGVVTTFAGSGTPSSADGTGTAASFSSPAGLAIDATGNLFCTEAGGNKIRKITSTAVVTTIAGSGSGGSADGTGATASFSEPRGVAVDASGNIYVADRSNNKIRKITSAGVVTTFAGSGTVGSADGTGTAASFYQPFGVTIDASGNIYVADVFNNKIRKITSAGDVTTFAGSGVGGSADGTGAAATFDQPRAVAVDASGNIYVADYGNNKIRKISLTGYTISPTLPTGLSFNATTGTISGTPTVVTPATNYTITATNTTGSNSVVISIATVLPVPVVLNKFNVEKSNKNVLVKWSTASEVNSKNFDVQRSIDGKEFSTIGIVEAKGVASEYNFTDEKSFIGINYYRLKQFDNDGKYNYSETKFVKFDGDGKLSFVMYPNPTKEKVNVYVNAFSGKGEIIVTDLLGKQIKQQVLVVGNNSIEIKKLTKGIYFVNIVTDKEKQTQKLVVE